MIELVAEPLSATAFAPFGEVIDLRDAHRVPINHGLTVRFHDLATVDVAADGGHALVNVFRSRPIALPHTVEVMERHPLGSQAFIPMGARRMLVLVGAGGQRIDADSLRLFVSDGHQGVNYFRNTWHHYQMVLDGTADFVVVDRGGPGANLEEVDLAHLEIRITRASVTQAL